MSASSPRSALYRRILLSAILTPLLFTAGILCMVGNQPLFLCFPPLMGALFLTLRRPYTPVATPVAQHFSESILNLNSRIRSFFGFCLFFGLMKLPEGKALFARLTDGSLIRWEVLATAAVMTLLVIYRNCRVLRELSDEQIAAYHQGDGPIRFSGAIRYDGDAFGKLRTPPQAPLPPRPDPY